MFGTALLAVLLITGPEFANAQDVFGGQGIRLGGSSQSARVGTGYTQSQAGMQAADPAANSNSMFGQTGRWSPFKKPEFPRWKMPKLKLPSFRNPDGSSRFEAWRPAAMTNWLPQRDPDAPSAWDRFNAKSRDMWEKTKGVFKRQPVDDGIASWDTIKEEMEQDQARRGIGSGIRPSIRAARGTKDPAFRY